MMVVSSRAKYVQFCCNMPETSISYTGFKCTSSMKCWPYIRLRALRNRRRVWEQGSCRIHLCDIGLGERSCEIHSLRYQSFTATPYQFRKSYCLMLLLATHIPQLCPQLASNCNSLRQTGFQGLVCVIALHT